MITTVEIRIGSRMTSLICLVNIIIKYQLAADSLSCEGFS
jgi:hypothetical protein